MPNRKYIRDIELAEHISQFPDLSFLRVEVPTVHSSALVRVRYALHGQEQEHGLRLDIEKQVFLDTIPEHDEMDGLLQKAAPKIAQYLGSVLYKSRKDSPPSRS